jgi:hypothetical protein
VIVTYSYEENPFLYNLNYRRELKGVVRNRDRIFDVRKFDSVYEN